MNHIALNFGIFNLVNFLKLLLEVKKYINCLDITDNIILFHESTQLVIHFQHTSKAVPDCWQCDSRALFRCSGRDSRGT